MAIRTMGNQFLVEEARKEHDLENDDLAIIAMVPAFAFDPAVHSTYADVSASEIAEAYGYVRGDQAGAKLLTNVAVVETATGARVDCDDAEWIATGGSIAECGSVIVFNKTHVNNTVICCIDFDGVDYLTTIGTLLQVDCANGLFSKASS